MLHKIVLLFCAVHSILGVPARDFFMLGAQTTKQMGQEVQSDCSNYISGGFVVHGVKHSVVCVSKP